MLIERQLDLTRRFDWLAQNLREDWARIVIGIVNRHFLKSGMSIGLNSEIGCGPKEVAQLNHNLEAVRRFRLSDLRLQGSSHCERSLLLLPPLLRKERPVFYLSSFSGKI